MAELDRTICVMGLGYIGLPTASLLATKGYKVHGVDVYPDVVETINRGDLHIYEPDLDVLVKSAVGSNRLTASLEPVAADIYIIAVPTPFHDGHRPDLSYVEAAVKAFAPHVKPGALIILESTSPVGATEKVAAWLAEERPDLAVHEEAAARGARVHIAHCPERVLPGKVLHELVANDRIVGGIDAASTMAAAEFYHSFVAGKVLTTTSRTAELAKLVENAYRDVNIAFANELSLIGDRLGVNVWELIELANHHPRVNILQPGPGVGGHCIAVDPWFIIDSAPEEAKIIKTARLVNDGKPDWVINKVREKAERFKAPRIACLGLSFKANIDDLRESPALAITRKLAQSGVGEVLAVEPYVHERPGALDGLDNLVFCPLDEALTRADIVLLLVDHDAFKRLDRQILSEKIVIDTRGLWR
jgi:UDP-N-acetyl-D-mannosaminuronic acid dehydrogenase